MKKIMTAVLCLGLLSACSAPKTASVSETETPEPEKKTIWIKEPEEEYSSVRPAMAQTKTRIHTTTTNFGEVDLYVDTPNSGNPGDWQSAGYSSDAVLVTRGNKQGIFSYEGEEIHPLDLNAVDSPYSQGLVDGWQTDGTPAAGLISTSASLVHVLSRDLKEISDIPLDQFVYDDQNAAERDFSNGTRTMLARKDDQLAVVGRIHTESIVEASTEFEPFNGTLPSNVILPVIGAGHQAESYVLCDTGGAVISELAGGPDYVQGSYINDHYLVRNGGYYDIYDAKTGQVIASGYQSAGYYNDGYIPVEAYGKWGFLDETGQQVTDFIFDGASSVYDGKAWVSYDGRWGVIDLKTSFDEGLQINLASVDPSEEEALGTIRVVVSGLQIHTGASVSSTAIGNSLEGTSYPYYETAEGDGYTWYRIAESAWIATDGTWIEEVKG